MAAAAVAPRLSSTTTATTMTSMTSEGSRTLLEIQDHARLIDHHAAHTSGGASTGSFSGSLTARAPAAGLWTAPEPAHGVRGGDTSPQWTNPASWPEQRGTPAYRPIDRNLDHSRRPWANTVPETIFTVTMIGLGVQTIGLANTIFRNTVGKIESVNRFFRYQCPHEL